MPGTLVIGYGGYGCNCARTYSEKYDSPVLLMDYRSFSEEEYTLNQDCLELTEDINLNAGRLRDVLSDYSQILLLSPLGGASFEAAHTLISECARDLDKAMVSLCTIPYTFESERREKALQTLATLPESVDNLFVIDLQRTIRDEAITENFSEFLAGTEGKIADLVHILADLLEKMPFFSYCSSPSYTIAVGKGTHYQDAISDALAHTYFEVPPSCGKIIAFTDMQVSDFDRDQASTTLAARGNAMPEHVGKSGLGEDTVLLFMPISCRRPL